MSIKGIVFDFGFTLFYFENPSVERYLETFNKGLERSINLLKELDILKNEQVTNKFFKLFNKKKRDYYKDIIKTKKEYTSSYIFKDILAKMVAKNMIEDFGNIPDSIYNELADLYHSVEAKVWRPFENTRKTLQELTKVEDLKLGVLSNHPHHDCIVNILKQHKLTDFFETVVTSAEFGKRKPNIDIFHYTIDKMGIEKECIKNCIMCGDEYADIVGGYRAGMQIILYNRIYKFPFEKQIDIPELKKIDDISEILNYLNVV